MAKAKKLPSGSWRCLVYDYTDPTGKRIYKSFTCEDPSPAGKRKAEFEAAAYAEEKERVSRSMNTMVFKDALDLYINERSSVLSPASIRKYKSMQKKFPALDNISLKNIDMDVVQKFINALSSNMSPKTVRDYNGLIIAVMNRYYSKTKINTVLPKKQRVERYIPTEEDIKKLVSAVRGTEMGVPVYLGAFAMMRRGEIAALNKSDIENNIIHVNKTMVYSDKNEWIIKSPKSYAGDRFIPVPNFVTDAFMELPGDGIEMTPNIITSRFEHVIKAAELKHFRFHDLRHYCASIQHALGIPDAYIMQAGGWGDDRVLKDVYRHALEDAKKKMSNVAISYFEGMQHEMQHEIEKAP